MGMVSIQDNRFGRVRAFGTPTQITELLKRLLEQKADVKQVEQPVQQGTTLPTRPEDMVGWWGQRRAGREWTDYLVLCLEVGFGSPQSTVFLRGGSGWSGTVDVADFRPIVKDTGRSNDMIWP